MALQAFRPLVIITLALLGLPASTISAAQFTIHPNDIYAGWSVHPVSGAVTNVGSQWIVPAVQCDAPLTNLRPRNNSRAAVWVGIWGRKNDPKTTWLAQIGTVSECGAGGASKSYKAVAQLYHYPCDPLCVGLGCQSLFDCPGSRPPYPGGYRSPGPTILFDVQPGDAIGATVNYYGRQSDNKLKYEAVISRGPSGGGIDIVQTILMLTDQGVLEADAAWQGGCIVESEPDSNFPAPFSGGLARFTTPITFTPFFIINNKLPEQWLETYSGYSTLFRWDMKPDGPNGKALATTGLPGRYGEFSVTWQDWR